MKTVAPIQFMRSSRREEALTNFGINRSPSLTAPAQSFAFANRFNASRFNVPALLVALALVLFASAAMAQIISPANLPLYFEANQNQTEFLSSGNGYQFTISASGVQMSLRESHAHAATAQMRFTGANPEAQIHGGGEMPGKVNYFIGNDPSKWQTGLPTFGNVQVTELYPGINMVFHGNQRQLEYDFAIAPGANLNAIKMQFEGVDKISVTPQGDLILRIANREIRQPKPEIYQTIAGQPKTVAGGYKILDSRTVAFETAEYDRSQPLVIDPLLGYSAFFAGNVGDTAWVVTLDASNYIYIAGETFSTHFSTAGAVQTNFAGGDVNGDAFVAKVDQTGTNLSYLTYLGGSGDDVATALAVDPAGNAFVGGGTDSKDFPTNNALYPTIPSAYSTYYGFQPGSGFVSELNTNGTQLKYSTYLGGKSANLVEAIAVDSADDAYAVGYTYSTNFPVTTNAFERFYAGTNGTSFLNPNGFLTEIAPGDTNLVYSTYLGGTNYDVATGVAVDTSNYVYVAGYTASFDFPTWNTPTNLPYGQDLNGLTNKTSIRFMFDGFVTKFPPLTNQPSSKTNLVYSTFLGGTNNDIIYGIAADGSGNAYVTGGTASTNFPNINSPPGLTSFLATNGNNGSVATNVFLTKIASNGSAVLDSAVFGGNLNDFGCKVAVDSGGDAFVVGTETSYTNFPTKNAFGSLLTTNSTGTGTHDAFVTGISANWSNVLYSACIGGNKDTYGYGIVLDPATTNVYITGSTDSTNYPTFNTGRYWFNGTNFINGTNYIDGTRFTGTNDAFLTEIAFTPGVLNLSAIEPTNNQTVGLFATVTFGVTATGAVGQVLYQWKKDGTNLVNGGRISGANSATLTITNAQASDSYTNYDLAVSYPGTIISPDPTNLDLLTTNLDSFTFSNIVLDVLSMPYVITVAPTNEVVYVGTNLSFSVIASGGPKLQYLWVLNHEEFLTNEDFLTNNPNISGANTTTLTITDARTNDTANYSITAYEYSNNIIFQTNIDVVNLTVVEPGITILSAPTNQTVLAGSTVSFSVVATGFPLSYQWQTSGTNVIDSTNISGATTSTLTFTNVQTSDAGTYTVTVTNDLESTNLSAILTVDPPAPYSITSITTVTNGSGTGLVLSGTGGTTNGPYYVLMSTNLSMPASQWTPILTNRFGTNGQFSFTNLVSTNGSQFFMLKQP